MLPASPRPGVAGDVILWRRVTAATGSGTWRRIESETHETTASNGVCPCAHGRYLTANARISERSRCVSERSRSPCSNNQHRTCEAVFARRTPRKTPRWDQQRCRGASTPSTVQHPARTFDSTSMPSIHTAMRTRHRSVDPTRVDARVQARPLPVASRWSRPALHPGCSGCRARQLRAVPSPAETTRDGACARRRHPRSPPLLPASHRRTGSEDFAVAATPRGATDYMLPLDREELIAS